MERRRISAPSIDQQDDQLDDIEEGTDRFDIDPDNLLFLDKGLRAAQIEASENASKLAAKEQDRGKRKREISARRLTQRMVDRAKPGEKEYTIKSALPGFGLRVRPSGEKRFILVYKAATGRFRRFTIGDARLMKLEEAETEALELRHRIRAGEDPQKEKQTRRDFTLDDFVRRYIEEHVRNGLSPAWGREVERILSKFALPHLGNCAVADITRRDLMRCAELGSTAQVRHKIRAVLSGLYTFGVQMDYVEKNILVGSKRFDRPRSRERVLDDRELSAVWHASFKLNDPWGHFGRLLILTGQRRSEVAGIHWNEIDLETKEWKLPEERMKNRQKHVVPLTDIMIDFLSSAPNQTGYVFESPRVSGRPVSGFSKAVERWKNEAKFHDWRVHDLRRTVASNLGKLGVAPHVIEAAIAHMSGVISGIAAVYNRHKYEDEKRQALEQWHEMLMEIVSKEYEPFVDPQDDIVL